MVLLGDPIVDLVCRTTGAQLQDAGLQLGGCCPVDAAEMRDLLKRFGVSDDHQRCGPPLPCQLQLSSIVLSLC